MGHSINFFEQNGPLGAVAKIELHHVLLVAGDIGRLGRGIHDVVSVAGQFLHEVSPCFEPVDSEGPAGAGLVRANDSAAAAAGARHILDLENGPLNGFPGDRIIFPDHQC